MFGSRKAKIREYRLSGEAHKELEMVVNYQEMEARKADIVQKGLAANIKGIMDYEIKRLGLFGEKDIHIDFSKAMKEGKIFVRPKTAQELKAEKEANEKAIKEAQEKAGNKKLPKVESGPEEQNPNAKS